VFPSQIEAGEVDMYLKLINRMHVDQIVITYLSEFFPPFFFLLSAFLSSALFLLLCFCCDSSALDSWRLRVLVDLVVEGMVVAVIDGRNGEDRG
jgi:hypothetical protein